MATLDADSAEPFEPLYPVENEGGHNAKEGYVMKRGFRFQSMPCFGAEYKRRYLVLRGKYLFRYGSANSKRAKGVPLDVENYSVEVVNDVEDDIGEIMAFAFRLVSVYKTYLFAAASEDERNEWVRAIAATKERAIKQRLGHADVEPWEKLTNNLGDRLTGIKARRDEMETQQDRLAPF